jgi:hypothetical protein
MNQAIKSMRKRLSVEVRLGIITIYEQNNLWAVPGKYK